MWDDVFQSGGKQEFALHVCQTAADVVMNRMVWFTLQKKMPPVLPASAATYVPEPSVIVVEVTADT